MKTQQLQTDHAELRLVTYGCGDGYRSGKFQPIRNREFVRPNGGLWASPVGCDWGWRERCLAEEFGDLTTQFGFVFRGEVLRIDSFADAVAMPWQDSPSPICNWPDYEVMQRVGVDAIHLTEDGQDATRFSRPSLYGWDCECVLIMNPKGITIERNAPRHGGMT